MNLIKIILILALGISSQISMARSLSDSFEGDDGSTDTNTPPIAYAGADFVVAPNEAVEITGKAIDKDGSIVRSTWLQTSGIEVSISRSISLISQPKITFTAPATSGKLTFKLIVTDDDFAKGYDELTVNVVANTPPSIDVDNDLLATSEETMTLTGLVSDEDGQIDNVVWEQISGTNVELIQSSLSNSKTAATFVAPVVTVGENLVFKITASDDLGASVSKEVTVVVTPPILDTGKELRELFSEVLANDTLSTGLLLDIGSVFTKSSIKINNGQLFTGPSLNTEDFIANYTALTRSVIDETTIQLPAVETIDVYMETQNESISSLMLAVVPYNKVPEQNLIDENVVNGIYVGPTKTEERLYSATTVLSKTWTKSPTFILPDSLVFGSQGLSISNMIMTVNGNQYPITRNVPFTINLDSADKQALFDYTIQYTLDDNIYYAKGQFEYTYLPTLVSIDSESNPSARSSSNLRCYDMANITADLSHPVASSNEYYNYKSKLRLRVYPSQGTVEEAEDPSFPIGIDPNDVEDLCHYGKNPKLKQVLVLVDGFSAKNDRRQNDIYEKFGSDIERYREMGFDVVTVNYVNSHAYIQSNGYAIRKLLTKRIPQWFASDADRRLVLIGGSMGTQTARFAMRSAEIAGEDHNVRLFVAFDGPFTGAHIPLGLQVSANFGSFTKDGRRALRGLNSPSSRQMLEKFYKRIDSSYYSWSKDSLGWDYYYEAKKLGLPQLSRNIAISNGSGTGSKLVNDHRENTAQMMNLLDVDDPAIISNLLGILLPLRSFILMKVRTDHENTDVFHGKIKLLGRVIKALTVKHYDNSKRDIEVGSFNYSPRQIADATRIFGKKIMTSPFPYHSFISTASALGITNHPSYVPAKDPYVFSRSPFDAIFWEKCSTEHVTTTPANKPFLDNELKAFLEGNGYTPPAQPELPVNKCGVAEPQTKPVAKCSVTFEESRGVINALFSASGSYDPNGNIEDYIWRFSDGTMANGKIVSKSFAHDPQLNEIHTGFVKVTDNDGEFDGDVCYIQTHFEITDPPIEEPTEDGYLE
ncbi:PKD domain-containing protein [Aliikangiella sp. G2MR2-5]|uniref:PKD domain-containing protein n=1 Tax=Aliikangiella sp. G2MR2-5 TaxID=2788943 RepID=UPI0018AA209C|nr:PKD domain-containing protein [Aliikangiella sp. G2MR2-5]